MPLVYDPTGVNPANAVVNEAHTPITEPDIWPTQGPFFASSLVVHGVSIADGLTHTLNLYTDFLWGALFTARANDTGSDVYSFIVLSNYTHWSSITLSYQAVGGDIDTVLASQIAAAGAFNRLSVNEWLNFPGDVVGIGNQDYNLENTGIVYLLASRLQEIAQKLSTPSTYVSFMMNDWAQLRTDVNALTAEINSWATSFTNNGVFTGSWVSTDALNTAVTNTINTVKGLFRKRLTGNTTFYVDHVSGNDANDGATSGTAFKTINAAITYITTNIDPVGHTVTLQLAAGTYDESITVTNLAYINLVIQGDAGSPTSAIVTCSTTTNTLNVSSGSLVTLRNLVISNTYNGGLTATGNAISALYYAVVTIGAGVTFATTIGAHMVTAYNARIIITESYHISGGAYAHLYVDDGGVEYYDATGTGIIVTFNGATAFTIFAIVGAFGHGVVLIPSSKVSFTGGPVTGNRYSISLYGLIDTRGGGANFLPGNAAGNAIDYSIYK